MTVLTHEIDHVIAQKHAGPTILENLCLACYACNSFKGSDVAGVSAVTGEIVRRFHPRRDLWSEHFRWNGPELIGLSPIGQVTIAVLRINETPRVRHRSALIAANAWLPPG